MSLRLITPPAAEPLSLADLEAQSRVELGDEVVLAQGYLTTARLQAEKVTRRALITQTWELTLDRFPKGEITVFPPPLQSVESIKYTDSNGAEQTLDPSSYKVDTASEPGRIVPAYGMQWPATRDEINAVRIRFVCGYGDNADDVPQPIRNWILLNAANLYEHRESVVVGQKAQMVELKTLADGLIDDYRVLSW